MFSGNATVADNLDKLFARDEGIYGPLEELPLAWQKGHHRRAEVLDKLNIGDVTNSVCVDFGCGSWGFAGIYPRLHNCKFAYGFDISSTALEQSARQTRDLRPPYWDRCKYMQSDGMDMKLEAESVDLIFGGEAIEHVRFPGRFLAECYRTLKFGGQLVLTTPNRDALLYRIQDDIYCNWVEHFWLFNWPELRDFVSEFFEIEEVVGFNGSIYRDLDKLATDHAAAEIWSKLFADRPDLATGIVLRAVKRRPGVKKQYRLTTIPEAQIRVSGPSKVMETGLGLMGTMMNSPASHIEFTVPAGADGLVLAMWRHLWSGFGRIQVGDHSEQRSFWAQDPGWYPLKYSLDRTRATRVTITADGLPDRRSLGHELIFCEAFTYSG